MNPWKLAIMGGMLAYSCSTKTPEPFANQKELQQDSLEMMLQLDTCNPNPIRIMTKEDSVKEIFLQKGYLELYPKECAEVMGDRLYTNDELLCSSFQPKNLTLRPMIRIMHYFFRNGREATFEAAEQLGAKYHQTKLTKDHNLTKLFKDANITIEGKVLDWLEVPGSYCGSLHREKKYFLGEDEIMMIVSPADWLDMDCYFKPAKDAGYIINLEAEFRGTIVNELSHEIQFKYFNNLFDGNAHEKLTAPFDSYKSEVPELKFVNNIQVAEFLSDVADWVEGAENGGVVLRFFNPLDYMSPDAPFHKGPEGRYEYSYKVQKYAMEQVLKNKGYTNPKAVVDELITKAITTDYTNNDEVFVLARKHFKEEDFKEIAKIYRRIGVDLLKTMQPYFKEQ